MQLIKELGVRGTGKDKRSWGVFICPSCNTHIDRPLTAGTVNKSCGSLSCRKEMFTANPHNKGNYNPDKLSNIKYYSAFSSKYIELKKKYKVCPEWSTFKAFHADMYSSYLEARQTASKLSFSLSGDIANKETLEFVPRLGDNRIAACKIAGKDFTGGIPENILTVKHISDEFNIEHSTLVGRLNRLKATKGFGKTGEATVISGTVRATKIVTHILTKEQYSTLRAAVAITASKAVPNSIYIIRYNNIFKIGISSNVGSRFSKLASSSPVPLELIYTKLLVNSRKTEKELHKKYQEYNSHGEWFNLTDAQLEEVIQYLDKH